MRRLLMFLAVMGTSLFASESRCRESAACGVAEHPPTFKRVDWGAELGWWQPWGNVESVVDGAPSLGLYFRIPYSDQLQLAISIRYQQPKARAYYRDNPPFEMALHQLTGDIGLLFPLAASRWSPQLGGGFSFIFIRADKPHGSLLLDDNESEFGHWFRLETPALPTPLQRLKWRLFLHQQTGWTLPQRSHFWIGGISLEGRLW